MDTSRINYGFSLIEVLISVVVLAVGLLGIAALQVNAIRFNHSAQLRAVAIAQVGSMIDRMRANHAGVESGQYNNISGIPTLPGCSICNTSETALVDANQWNTMNALLLPAGQGTVVGNGNQYTITVRWDNERSGSSGTGCSGNAQVDLTCLIMEVQL